MLKNHPCFRIISHSKFGYYWLERCWCSNFWENSLRTFTGCVLGVYTNNATLYKKAFGTLTPKWGLYAPQVNLDTYFDANFITQILGINSGLMQLYDQQKINVTDKATKHLFDFDNNGKRNITLINLMVHNSGLQSTIT